MRTRAKKQGKKVLGVTVAATMAGVMAMTNLGVLSVFASKGSDGWYYTDFKSFEEEQAYAKQYSIKLEGESIVLLKNNGALPLSNDKNVTLFGNTSYYHLVGKNSGDTDRTGFTMLPDALANAGFNVNPMVKNVYDVLGPEYTYDYGYFNGPGDKAGLSNPLRTELPTSLFSNVEGSYMLYGDAAITTIGREGNEDYDIPTAESFESGLTGFAEDAHALMLSENEKAMISYMKEHFGKVIVLVNCASTMDLTALEDDPDIDAIVWIGCPGQYGMDAVAQVLDGTINPSGRTVDIYSADITKNPSYFNSINNTETLYVSDGKTENSVQYEEDIYVGYKWYETAAADNVLKKLAIYDKDQDTYEGDDEYYNRSTGVLYPFGYGLSYTTFEQEFVTQSFAIPEGATLDTFIDVDVKVTNTGSVAGKEVVQLYINAPYYKNEVEKAEVSLVSFAKSNTLKPGQSQVVTLSVRVGDIASFDYKGISTHSGTGTYKGYVIDSGDYELRLQSNSHDEIDNLEFNVSTGIRLDNDADANNNTPLSNGDDYDTLLVMKEANSTMTLMSRANFVNTFPTAPSKEVVKYGANLTSLIGETTNIYSNIYDLANDTEEMPWYVKEVEAGWTQGEGARVDGKTPIQLADMKGINYYDESTSVTVNGTQYESGKAAWDAYLNQLTWDELLLICTRGSYGTEPIDAIGKPETFDEDGPEKFNGGTYFPCPTNQAACWNIDLAYMHGVLAANECMYLGFTGWYAPAFNIHRSPFCGRNRSYYSEDGIQSALIAAATCQGAEDNGVYCFAKHLAANEQETGRSNLVTWVSEQALREIYLKPFEYSVKLGEHFGGARAMMTAMNRLGAIGCCGNYAMLTDIIRNEWDFKGFIVSDSYKDGWPKANMMQRAGCDIPLGTYSGSNVLAGKWDNEIGVYYEVEGNKVTSPTQWAVVRNSAERILWVTANSIVFKNQLDTSLFGEKFEGETVQLNAGVPVNYSLSVDTEAYGTDVIMYQVVDGALPDGLSIDNTGTIVGIPTTTGSYTVTIRQSGAGWVTSEATLTFVVSPLITSTNGWTANTGKAFSTRLTQESYVLAEGDDIKNEGAIGSLSYTLLTPVSGLTLSTDGVLSGTPTDAGTYTVTVRITYTVTEKYFANLTGAGNVPQAPSGGWCRQSAPVIIDTTYTLTVEDAVDFDPDSIPDGQYVAAININNDNELVIYYQDGTSANLGSIGAEAGKSIASAAINDNGELVLTYTDNSTANLGVVVGADGNDGAPGADGADGKDGVDGVNGSGCGGSIGIASTAALSAIALMGVAAFILIRRKKNNN